MSCFVQYGCAMARKMIAQPTSRCALTSHFKWECLFLHCVICAMNAALWHSTSHVYITQSHMCMAEETLKNKVKPLSKQLMLAVDMPTYKALPHDLKTNSNCLYLITQSGHCCPENFTRKRKNSVHEEVQLSAGSA